MCDTRPASLSNDNTSDLNKPFFFFTEWTFTKTAKPPDDGFTDVAPAQDEIVELNVSWNCVFTYIPKTRT